MEKLEQHFIERAKAEPQSFAFKGDYGAKYQNKLDSLRRHVYPSIDVGLSANSGGPDSIYTRHDSEHFDFVVKYAGQLLTTKPDGTFFLLAPQELYVLLLAIRIHDAGNALGREQHETRCMEVLQQISNELEDQAELQLIANIARAHGGKVSSTDKDTIGTLQANAGIGSVKVRARKLAAITRFADEICELSPRAFRLLLKQNALPEASKLFHAYANTITSSVVDPATRFLEVTYSINCSDLGVKYLNGPASQFLADFILDRLEKMNLERIYYNAHVDQDIAVRKIEATLNFLRGHACVHTVVIGIESKGFPEGPENSAWRRQAQFENFGEKMRNSHEKPKA